VSRPNQARYKSRPDRMSFAGGERRKESLGGKRGGGKTRKRRKLPCRGDKFPIKQHAKIHATEMYLSAQEKIPVNQNTTTESTEGKLKKKKKRKTHFLPGRVPRAASCRRVRMCEGRRIPKKLQRRRHSKSLEKGNEGGCGEKSSAGHKRRCDQNQLTIMR